MKREIRAHRAAGYTPINALHAVYMFGTPATFELDHRTLRRTLPPETTVRVTRVRKNPDGTYTRYGDLVVQQGSDAHRACQAHPEHGLLLIDGAVARMRRASEEAAASTLADEDVVDPDAEILSEEDIDTEIDVERLDADAYPIPTPEEARELLGVEDGGAP